MKRKPINQVSNNQVPYILSKIDEAVSSLNKNEDELGKVLAELSLRNLSEKDVDTLNSAFKAYERSAKSVEQITEN